MLEWYCCDIPLKLSEMLGCPAVVSDVVEMHSLKSFMHSAYIPLWKSYDITGMTLNHDPINWHPSESVFTDLLPPGQPKLD
jgi:hypothetical protein